MAANRTIRTGLDLSETLDIVGHQKFELGRLQDDYLNETVT